VNRIDATFARLRAAGRTALIPYVTAGDPSPAMTVPILSASSPPGGHRQLACRSPIRWPTAR
jgi:tryptophan synthase alpha chain